MRVKVTEDHIANGKKKAKCFCPIALALKETVGDYEHLYVYSQDVSIYFKDPYWTHFHLPKEGKEFVSNFDKGFPVSPITLTLVEKTDANTHS